MRIEFLNVINKVLKEHANIEVKLSDIVECKSAYDYAYMQCKTQHEEFTVLVTQHFRDVFTKEIYYEVNIHILDFDVADFHIAYDKDLNEIV